jgi:DNA invertase Pin-like site-specific DNA recombinase
LVCPFASRKTHRLGAIAQLKTELRAERQRDATQDARARGVTCGRTKRITSQRSLELWNRRQQETPIKTLMADYGLSMASVYRYLSEPPSAPTTTTE